jgi:O-antigen/teichoic acid export membrane protein
MAFGRAPTTPAPSAPAAPARAGSAAGGRAGDFARGARVLSVGIALTGLLTFAYLATASHVLGRGAYSRLSLCWAIMFVILSVIYRPIEQLLSRTLAERRASGVRGRVLRTPAILQLGFALAFLVAALALRDPLEHHVFRGSPALFWVLTVAVVVYAASYFARGWLAGNQRFALYGALVLMESTSRFCFALAVALGVGAGVSVVGAGMAAAPLVSLCVIPLALPRIGSRQPGLEPPDPSGEGPAQGQIEQAAGDLTEQAAGDLAQAAGDLTLRRGGGFAAAVLAVMLSEQTLMNAGVLIVAASSSFDLTSGLTGFVFNVMLIVRAPLQLFQSVQTSILPHLTGLHVRQSAGEFARALRITLRAIAVFALAVAVGLLAIGPSVMRALLGSHGYVYGRVGLAIVGLGMGFHLASGTLNQALLARGRPVAASVCWLTAAGAFVCFVALPTIPSQVERVEVGYCLAAAALATLLALANRLAGVSLAGASEPGGSE